MHLFISKSERRGHRSAFNENAWVFLFVFTCMFVHCILSAACNGAKWTEYEQQGLWTRGSRKTSNESRRVYFCVLLCVCVFHHHDVVECNYKQRCSAPTGVVGVGGGGGEFSRTLVETFYLLLTHICFMFTSSGEIQRAPVSVTPHPACIIIIGCRAFGHVTVENICVIVLLLRVGFKQACSGVNRSPVFLTMHSLVRCCELHDHLELIHHTAHLEMRVTAKTSINDPKNIFGN